MLQTNKTIQLNIVSTERSIFSGDVNVVSVTAEQGEMGIYPGHAPLLTKIVPGFINFQINGKEQSFYVSGGYIEIQPTVVVILADTCIRGTDIDLARVNEKKAQLEEQLGKQDVHNKTKLQAKLNKELAKIHAYELANHSIQHQKGIK